LHPRVGRDIEDLRKPIELLDIKIAKVLEEQGNLPTETCRAQAPISRRSSRPAHVDPELRSGARLGRDTDGMTDRSVIPPAMGEGQQDLTRH
jgi:hypothetical protein